MLSHVGRVNHDEGVLFNAPRCLRHHLRLDVRAQLRLGQMMGEPLLGFLE